MKYVVIYVSMNSFTMTAVGSLRVVKCCSNSNVPIGSITHQWLKISARKCSINMSNLKISQEIIISLVGIYHCINW